MSKKIKVAGYTKKINYTDGISYRPFSTLNKPLEEGTIFSAGNFNVTINTDQHFSKIFKTKEFSDYIDLDSLGVDDVKLSLISDLTTKTKLNLNNHILKNYAYFGSIKERLRVALEKIIITFPAAIVINPYYYDNNDLIINGAIKDIDDLNNGTMQIILNKSNFANPYDIVVSNEDLKGLLFNETNKWRNFVETHIDYAIIIDNKEYKIKGIKDNTQASLVLIIDYDEDLLNKTDFSEVVYLRPNNHELEYFYNSLDEFELELLNRNSFPKNTYNFIIREFKDNGIFIETNKKGTWTTSDGYNLDFDNPEYLEYVNKLINICDDIDMNSSNLIIRQMIATSLLEFDTVSSDINDNIYDSSQKIKSVLSIYGRSFDNVKNYIDGIAFANNITYDKEDNAPDKYLRDIAKSYGWDIFENQHYINILNDTLTKNDDNLTKNELDNELWRRLILNTPFLWKSKGTRKSVEFIINFLGIPRGMISFNEYVYKTKNKLNYEDVLTIVDNTNNNQNILDLPLDESGYPRIPYNTTDMYYQKAGGWYSITGGNNSDIDNNLGNNPHMGGYDSGVAYLNQFKNIIEDFKPVKEVAETIIYTESNLFKSYNNGRFDLTDLTIDLSNTNDATAYIMDKYPLAIEYDDCGCEITYKLKELEITPIKQEDEFPCSYDYTIYTDDGKIEFYKGVTKLPIDEECCSLINGEYIYNYTTRTYVCAYKTIIDCARYQFVETVDGYAYFTDLETGENINLVPSSECCPVGSTPIGDNENGFRCQIGVDITKKCIEIYGIELTNIYETNGEDFIQYKNGEDGTIKRHELNNTTGLQFVNGITQNNSSILISWGGYTKEFNYNHFISQTGSTLIPPLTTYNVQCILDTHPSRPIFNVIIRYIDCPTIKPKPRCVRLEYISSSNREYLSNLNISYLSEISNTTINISNKPPTSDNPPRLILDNGYGLNVVSANGKVMVSRGGQIIELDLNQIIQTKTPTLDDDLRYRYEFVVNGIQYDLYFKYITCPDCIEYDVFEIVSGLSIVNQNVNILKFIDTSQSNEFYSVISRECCPINSTPITYNGLLYCKEKTTLIPFKMDSSSTSGIGTACPVSHGGLPDSAIVYTNNFVVGGVLYYDVYGDQPFGSGGVPNTSRFVIYNNEWYSLSFMNGVITDITKCSIVPKPLTFFADGEYLKLTGAVNITDDGTFVFTHYEIQWRLMSSSGTWDSFNLNYVSFVSQVWERTGIPAGTYTVRGRIVTNNGLQSDWVVVDNVVVTGFKSEIIIGDVVKNPCLTFPPVKGIDVTAYAPLREFADFKSDTQLYVDPNLTVKFIPREEKIFSLSNLRGDLVLSSNVKLDGKIEAVAPCGIVATPVKVGRNPISRLDSVKEWNTMEKITLYNDSGFRVRSKFFLNPELTEIFDLTPFNGKFIGMQSLDESDSQIVRFAKIEGNTIDEVGIPIETGDDGSVKVVRLNNTKFFETPINACQVEIVPDELVLLYSNELVQGNRLYTDEGLNNPYIPEIQDRIYLQLISNDVNYSTRISKDGYLVELTPCNQIE